jgi:hypothetical protein
MIETRTLHILRAQIEGAAPWEKVKLAEAMMNEMTSVIESVVYAIDELNKKMEAGA